MMRLLTALLLAATCWANATDSDPSDTTQWPNTTSRANGDRWLAENHDKIRKMSPRVLVVNFSNEAKKDHIERLVGKIIEGVREGSRYHGYKDAKAPAFLDYQVFKYADLREADKTKGNCPHVPIKTAPKNKFNMDYSAYFSEKFAALYGVKDPKDESRFLRLDELVERGYVHELWFVLETVPEVAAYESVELKPKYNESFERIGNEYVQAGNGGDEDQKWTGRSIRIACINPTRGPGCFLESLSHSFEGMANCGAIPYLQKYFKEFAGFDLDKRFGLPINSFYPLWGDRSGIGYPNATTAVVTNQGREFTITNYVAIGGNAHFPPNGRRHYDLDNKDPVMAMIEDWRIGNSAKPWSNEAFAAYRELGQDCMGGWLIYWRQNFPGLDNKQKDDAGKPMKNWWPFLFY